MSDNCSATGACQCGNSLPCVGCSGGMCPQPEAGGDDGGTDGEDMDAAGSGGGPSGDDASE
jgi:hypothetical protein